MPKKKIEKLKKKIEQVKKKAKKNEYVIDLDDDLDVATIALVLRHSFCDRIFEYLHFETDLKGAYQKLAERPADLETVRARLDLGVVAVPSEMLKAVSPFIKFDTTYAQEQLEHQLASTFRWRIKTNPADDFPQFLIALKAKLRIAAKQQNIKVVGGK